MATTNHDLQETIELAVKVAVQKAKLDLHPVGKTGLPLVMKTRLLLQGGGGEKINTYVLQCSSDKHKAGETIEAGLPNITGTFSRQVNNSYGGDDGAFYNRELGAQSSGQYSGTGYPSGVGFDASRSNQIYGKSDTVQPNTIIINVWKRVS